MFLAYASMAREISPNLKKDSRPRYLDRAPLVWRRQKGRTPGGSAASGPGTYSSDRIRRRTLDGVGFPWTDRWLILLLAGSMIH